MDKSKKIPCTRNAIDSIIMKQETILCIDNKFVAEIAWGDFLNDKHFDWNIFFRLLL